MTEQTNYQSPPTPPTRHICECCGKAEGKLTGRRYYLPSTHENYEVRLCEKCYACECCINCGDYCGEMVCPACSTYP